MKKMRAFFAREPEVKHQFESASSGVTAMKSGKTSKFVLTGTKFGVSFDVGFAVTWNDQLRQISSILIIKNTQESVFLLDDDAFENDSTPVPLWLEEVGVIKVGRSYDCSGFNNITCLTLYRAL